MHNILPILKDSGIGIISFSLTLHDLNMLNVKDEACTRSFNLTYICCTKFILLAFGFGGLDVDH